MDLIIGKGRIFSKKLIEPLQSDIACGIVVVEDGRGRGLLRAV